MAWLRRRKHLRQRAGVKLPAPIMSNIRGHLLLALFLFTAGCIKVGPDFAPPPVSVSQKWLESADKHVSTQPAEYRAWWRAFNDPVLDRLIDSAYRENLTLRQAGVRVLEARAQLGIARGELFPQTQQGFGSLEFNRLSGRSPEAVSSPELSYFQSEIGGRVNCTGDDQLAGLRWPTCFVCG